MKKLIPLLLLLVSMPSLAERQFDIEVIIFERVVELEDVNESWPSEVPQIDFTHAHSMHSQHYIEEKGVTLLPPESFELQHEAQELREHAGYKLLVHKAWRQGDEGKADSPIFHIRAGKDFSHQFHPDGSEIELDTATHSPIEHASGEHSPIEEVTETTLQVEHHPLYELDAKLQIYVQHYLFAEAQMDLKSPISKEVIIEDSQIESATVLDSININKPNSSVQAADNQDRTNQESASQDASLANTKDANSNVITGHLESITPQREVQTFLKSYRFDQKRRMRSSETHYLDHPLMGMIIQVRRVPQQSAD